MNLETVFSLIVEMKLTVVSIKTTTQSLWYMDLYTISMIYGPLYNLCGLWTSVQSLWSIDLYTISVVYGPLYSLCGLWTSVQSLWSMDLYTIVIGHEVLLFKILQSPCV